MLSESFYKQCFCQVIGKYLDIQNLFNDKLSFDD